MKHKTAPRAHVTLEAGCTLHEAIELQFLLLTTKCASDTVIVDGALVERVDTAGLQLLVAFALDQARAGRSLRWSGASDLLVRSSRRLGLDTVLGLAGNTDIQVLQP